MTPAVAGSASRLRYEFCIGPSMRPSKRHAEQIRKAEIAAAASRFVAQRRGERGQQAAAALDERRGWRRTAHRTSAAASARISSLKRIEAIGCEECLVHELERHARLDERVIHAEHVVLVPIAFGRRRGGTSRSVPSGAAPPAPAAPRCADTVRGRSATDRCARRSAASAGRRARRRTSSPRGACRWPCPRRPRAGSPARSARSPSSDTAPRRRR